MIDDVKPKSAALRSAVEGSKRLVGPGAILTVTEACEYLKISKTKLYELIREGGIKSAKVGGQRRIRMRAIQEFLTRREEAGF